MDAVAAVFEGLIQLTRSMPGALGDVIATMEALFESGLKSRVARETEIGLAGELLVIAEAVSFSTLVQTWHSKAEGRFDFSSQGERLEVKTTSASERVHWFGSEQLAPIPGACTTFVSILLPLVESGETVASVFAGMKDLTSEEQARVRRIIIDVTKEPPELLTSIVFDRAVARRSLRHFTAQGIPTPEAVPGVGRMRWEAKVEDFPAHQPPAGTRRLLDGRTPKP
ncbi:PD-(D/E)XK motif protein [Phycicoccus sp. HDW14]|uniref:PD-(D/E)XK motif protein n=1 Tax=Phycicoccus sp. HDW14 TaxID=2714941 RepID=UPI00140D36EE|nr:PD-(D/E)XK motif protein [Phycicoccus sp. HDW14]QIM22370.1 PD-(D/E)XK motif protein [Phycicoccus sp. HDW14]